MRPGRREREAAQKYRAWTGARIAAEEEIHRPLVGSLGVSPGTFRSPVWVTSKPATRLIGSNTSLLY